MNDGVKLSGHIQVWERKADGSLRLHEDKKNVVVTVGKNYLATGAGLADFTEVAAGTGATAATSADTALVAEAFRKAGAQSSSLNVWQNSVTYLAGDGTGLIQEIGLFNGLTLLARQTITSFNKTASNSMIVIWQITIS